MKLYRRRLLDGNTATSSPDPVTQYTVRAEVKPSVAGTPVVSSGTNRGTQLTLNSGSNYQITVTGVSSGYEFQDWTNNIDSNKLITETTTGLTLTKDIVWTANYNEKTTPNPTTYTLKVEKDSTSTGNGTLYIGSAGTTEKSGIAAGDEITITAEPEVGMRFTQWSESNGGTAISTREVLSYTMPASNKTLYGKFEPVFTLSVRQPYPYEVEYSVYITEESNVMWDDMSKWEYVGAGYYTIDAVDIENNKVTTFTVNKNFKSILLKPDDIYLDTYTPFIWDRRFEQQYSSYVLPLESRFFGVTPTTNNSNVYEIWSCDSSGNPFQKLYYSTVKAMEGSLFIHRNTNYLYAIDITGKKSRVVDIQKRFQETASPDFTVDFGQT